jgi:acetyl esterase/lipase
MSIYARSVTALNDEARARLEAESRSVAELAVARSEMVPDLATAEGLALARMGMDMMGGAEADGVELIELPSPDGALGARVISPGRVRGVCLDVHGGGWCLGSARMMDSFLAPLADELEVATVSIDYRLAPEHPYPAGVDDVEAALRWLIAEAPTRFGTDRILVQGASAGAHLLALALLRIRDADGAESLASIRGAGLMFGGYDLSASPSARLAEDVPIIPTRTVEVFLEHFVPGTDPETRRDPRYSPLYADLHGLVPARFTVGADDPFVDDSMFMAARWEAAGNHSELGVYPHSLHGFVAMPSGYGPLAAADSAEFYRAALRDTPNRTVEVA